MTHDRSTQTRPLADDAARGMPRLPLWVASLTIETGLLHMIACSDHFREWWGYGREWWGYQPRLCRRSGR
jgi:hypothetical protein